MMTSLSGVRGIGKTYFLSKELFARKKQGFLCISNFHHLTSHIQVTRNKEQIFDVIREIGRLKKMGWEICDIMPTFTHSGVFFGIDEAHLSFSADDWKRYQKDDMGFVVEFLAQARKSDVEIWYTTQDPAKIDKNWRRYTEDWIRYRPVIPFKRKVLKPHPTRPTLRAEVRYFFPLMREEHHNLDHGNPEFNMGYTKDENGWLHPSRGNTLQYSRYLLSGWLDPFPYTLYDSHEMLAMDDMEDGLEQFPLLKNTAYIMPGIDREKFPTFKDWLHMPRRDKIIPERVIPETVDMPSMEDIRLAHDKIVQPEVFVKNIRDFLGSRNKYDAGPKRQEAQRSTSEQPGYADWISKVENGRF